MLQQTQESLAERISVLQRLGGTDLAGSVYRQPAEDYTAAAMLEREKKRLFLGAPLPVALSPRAKNPGDWFTYELLGQSVLVSRQSDGTLRAYVNACKHRGMQVATGEGSGARNFICPYHGWTYRLDGCLRGRPAEAAFEGAPKEGLGLQCLPVSEVAGIIFIGFAAGADPRGPLLAGADTDLEPLGLRDYHRFDSREHEGRMNWKLGVDTFLEAYHIHKLHRESIKRFFLDDTALFDPFGHHGRLCAVRRSIENREPNHSLLQHLTTIYHLFPNCMLVYQQDHVQFFELLPHRNDPDRCCMRLTIYTPQAVETDSARRYFTAHLDLALRVITTEDFAACERIQANLCSGVPSELIFGRNEPALIHFHQQLAEALA